MDPVRKMLSEPEKHFTRMKVFDCMSCGKPKSANSYNPDCDRCKKLPKEDWYKKEII